MPQISSMHTDRPLTSFAVAQMPMTEFPLFDILKPLPVKKKSDEYYIYDAGWLFGYKEAAGENRFQRAPGATYDRVEYVHTTGSYSCNEYGLEHVVDDAEQANADSPLDPLQDGALAVRTQLMTESHAQLAALLCDSGTTFASYTSAVATSWATHDTAEPVADADVAWASMIDNGTFVPSMHSKIVVMAQDEYTDLLRNADLIDRVKYTGLGAGQVTAQAAAQYLKADKLVVIPHVEVSSDDGQTFATGDVWTSGVVGFYAVPKGRPGLKAPGLGFTAIWNAANGGDAMSGFAIKRYRDESINSWVVRGNMHYDPKVSQAASGYLKTGA
jgi:hypothetical protein